MNETPTPRKYQAHVVCAWGCVEVLSDEEYEAIIGGRKDLELKCGHPQWTAKITARHNLKAGDWKMAYGSTR